MPRGCKLGICEEIRGRGRCKQHRGCEVLENKDYGRCQWDMNSVSF